MAAAMEKENKAALQRWEGKVSVDLKELGAEKVWPLVEDFCNIHKFFPSVETCYLVEGVPGQPGLVRHCSRTIRSSPGSCDDDEGDDEGAVTQWAKEKLLTIDPVKRCFSYEVLENNVGFRSYVATIRVLPVQDTCENSGVSGSCKIEWSFVSEANEKWRMEDFVSFMEKNLKFMANKIEQELFQPTADFSNN